MGIDPDPVKWIDRLRDVNDTSSFSEAQRALIDNSLSILARELGKLNDTDRSS